MWRKKAKLHGVHCREMMRCVLYVQAAAVLSVLRRVPFSILPASHFRSLCYFLFPQNGIWGPLESRLRRRCLFSFPQNRFLGLGWKWKADDIYCQNSPTPQVFCMVKGKEASADQRRECTPVRSVDWKAYTRTPMMYENSIEQLSCMKNFLFFCHTHNKRGWGEKKKSSAIVNAKWLLRHVFHPPLSDSPTRPTF